MSRDFFQTVVAATGLSSIFAASVVRRSCEMAGMEVERLTAQSLRDLMPALRKGLGIFLPNVEVERAMQRLEAMLPRPVEEPAAP